MFPPVIPIPERVCTRVWSPDCRCGFHPKGRIPCSGAMNGTRRTAPKGHEARGVGHSGSGRVCQSRGAEACPPGPAGEEGPAGNQRGAPPRAQLAPRPPEARRWGARLCRGPSALLSPPASQHLPPARAPPALRLHLPAWTLLAQRINLVFPFGMEEKWSHHFPLV